MMPFDPDTQENPEDILGGLLEATRSAYFNDDFEAFQRHFTLPTGIESPEGAQTIEDLAALRRVFDAMRETMRELGVIDMKRRVVSAQYTAPDKITCRFVSEFILLGYQVSDEVRGESRLVAQEDGWKIQHTSYETSITSVIRALLRR